jgi:hypothetical protein
MGFIRDFWCGKGREEEGKMGSVTFISLVKISGGRGYSTFPFLWLASSSAGGGVSSPCMTRHDLIGCHPSFPSPDTRPTFINRINPDFSRKFSLPPFNPDKSGLIPLRRGGGGGGGCSTQEGSGVQRGEEPKSFPLWRQLFLLGTTHLFPPPETRPTFYCMDKSGFNRIFPLPLWRQLFLLVTTLPSPWDVTYFQCLDTIRILPDIPPPPFFLFDPD